mmetsp:Transcript_93985/g.265406  ORF Transcript_93985/g.265406 Transcript_93985/m.265406 type:complete len:82 (+) Transcript_93985:448-693(+)
MRIRAVGSAEFASYTGEGELYAITGTRRCYSRIRASRCETKGITTSWPRADERRCCVRSRGRVCGQSTKPLQATASPHQQS